MVILELKVQVGSIPCKQPVDHPWCQKQGVECCTTPIPYLKRLSNDSKYSEELAFFHDSSAPDTQTFRMFFYIGNLTENSYIQRQFLTHSVGDAGIRKVSDISQRVEPGQLMKEKHDFFHYRENNYITLVDPSLNLDPRNNENEGGYYLGYQPPLVFAEYSVKKDQVVVQFNVPRQIQVYYRFPDSLVSGLAKIGGLFALFNISLLLRWFHRVVIENELSPPQKSKKEDDQIETNGLNSTSGDIEISNELLKNDSKSDEDGIDKNIKLSEFVNVYETFKEMYLENRTMKEKLEQNEKDMKSLEKRLRKLEYSNQSKED